MPELPDVEVYKRYFDSTALHQQIDDAQVLEDNLLDGSTAPGIRKALRGASFEETRRHGKHLFARLSTGNWLALHFGMTGALKYYKHDETAPEYGYFRVDFENGYHLALVVPRKLGHVHVIDDPDNFIAAHDLGPDALGLDFEPFSARLGERRGMIKPALMDQSVLAGLGNVYSDEILFQAGIHPRTKLTSLDDEKLRGLFDALNEVLDTAIDCKADPEKLPAERFLLPHRSGDKRDPYSGRRLEKISVGGRTGYYSPARQSGP